jgi:predicted Mrr-cat superfamily restriction endonuclease
LTASIKKIFLVVTNDFPEQRIVVVHGAFPFTNELFCVKIANAAIGNL